MTYGQVKDRVLQLLNQYTVAGTPVASSYNNQQDYLNRIPALVNDAVMEIATTAKKIPVTMTLLITEEQPTLGNMYVVEMPDDFFQFKTGDTLVTTTDGHLFHTNNYMIRGKKHLLIPKHEIEVGKTYYITYYRYPNLLAIPPADTAELDNDPDTHYAVPFYVAAYLVIHDDSFLYASFYNKYEDKLAKLSVGISAEVHPVDDVYNLDPGFTYWS